jgi:hypothetical protein
MYSPLEWYLFFVQLSSQVYRKQVPYKPKIDESEMYVLKCNIFYY